MNGTIIGAKSVFVFSSDMISRSVHFSGAPPTIFVNQVYRTTITMKQIRFYMKLFTLLPTYLVRQVKVVFYKEIQGKSD